MPNTSTSISMPNGTTEAPKPSTKIVLNFGANKPASLAKIGEAKKQFSVSESPLSDSEAEDIEDSQSSLVNSASAEEV